MQAAKIIEGTVVSGARVNTHSTITEVTTRKKLSSLWTVTKVINDPTFSSLRKRVLNLGTFYYNKDRELSVLARDGSGQPNVNECGILQPRAAVNGRDQAKRQSKDVVGSKLRYAHRRAGRPRVGCFSIIIPLQRCSEFLNSDQEQSYCGN
jgi:hypothetical protein